MRRGCKKVRNRIEKIERNCEIVKSKKMKKPPVPTFIASYPAPQKRSNILFWILGAAAFVLIIYMINNERIQENR